MESRLELPIWLLRAGRVSDGKPTSYLVKKCTTKFKRDQVVVGKFTQRLERLISESVLGSRVVSFRTQAIGEAIEKCGERGCLQVCIWIRLSSLSRSHEASFNISSSDCAYR